MVKSELTREVEAWDDVIRWIVTLGAAYLPLLMSSITADAFEIPKATVLYVLAIALLTAFIIRSLYAKRLLIGKSLLDIPALLFIAMIFISTLTSPSPVLSVIGQYGYYENIPAFCSFAVFYFMASRFITNSDHIKRLVAHIITAFALVSIYGLLQHFGIDARQPFLRAMESQLGSTLGSPILLGGYCALVLPLIFNAIIDIANKNAADTGIVNSHVSSVGATNESTIGSLANPGNAANSYAGSSDLGLSKPVLLLSFALGIANIFLTQSHGALLGLAIGLLLISIIRRKDIAIAKKVVSAATVLAFIITAIAVILPAQTPTGNQSINLNADKATPNQSKINNLSANQNPISNLLKTSMEVRKELWKSAVWMVSVRPVSGYGPDQAHNWWLRFQTLKHAKLEPDTPINRARNEFLQIAINSGVPGLLVFLWIFIASIFILTKNIKNARQKHPENTFESSLYLMITASFIAYFAQALFGIASVGIYPLIWVLFGVTSTAKEEPYLEFAISKQPRQLFAIATLSTAMLISAYAFKPLIADFHSFKGKVYRHSGDIARASKELGLAIHYNPSQAVYRKDLSLIYYEQAKKTNNARLAQQGVSIIEQALSINPDDSSVMANIAVGYRIGALLAKENSLFNTAELYYGRTIEACPNFISPRRAMLGMLLTEENYDDAIEQALYILQIDPNDTDVKYRLGLAYEKTGKIGRARRVYSEILAKYPDTADVKMALARTGR